MKYSWIIVLAVVCLLIAACEPQKEQNSQASGSANSDISFPYEVAKQFITNNGMNDKDFYPPTEFVGWSSNELFESVEVVYKCRSKYGEPDFNQTQQFLTLQTDNGKKWFWYDSSDKEYKILE